MVVDDEPMVRALARRALEAYGYTVLEATRAEVLDAAAWAGFELDEAANADGGQQITRATRPSAWVIPTDEELMIARHTIALMTTAGSKVLQET